MVVMHVEWEVVDLKIFVLGKTAMKEGKSVRDSKGKGQIRKEGGREAAAAVGALLGFYRRIDGRSQKELSTDASLHPSEIAMYESAQRLPSSEALEKISSALKLDPFQSRQLQLVAMHAGRTVLAGHEWTTPDDVLHGVPMFMRRLEKESDFQRAADISNMWVVASKPLAATGKMYEALHKRLLRDETEFVYFIGGGAAEESFQVLWSRLCSDSPRLKAVIPKRLQCVLAPASLCLYHFAICNPGQQSRMFGRAVMHQNGLPVGFYAMDPAQVLRAYQLLDPAYELCKSRKGKSVTTEYGTFRLLEPI